jgi:hypothetical protein
MLRICKPKVLLDPTSFVCIKDGGHVGYQDSQYPANKELVKTNAILYPAGKGKEVPPSSMSR